jgi:hypothetical protein
LRAAAHSVRFEASHVRWPLQLCTARLTSRPSARILACCAHAVVSSLNDFEFVQTGRPAVQLLSEISTTNSRLAILESQVGEGAKNNHAPFTNVGAAPTAIAAVAAAAIAADHCCGHRCGHCCCCCCMLLLLSSCALLRAPARAKQLMLMTSPICTLTLFNDVMSW